MAKQLLYLFVTDNVEIIYEIYNKHINITKLYRKTPKLSNYIVFSQNDWNSYNDIINKRIKKNDRRILTEMEVTVCGSFLENL
mgnify:CR=1 FL=1